MGCLRHKIHFCTHTVRVRHHGCYDSINSPFFIILYHEECGLYFWACHLFIRIVIFQCLWGNEFIRKEYTIEVIDLVLHDTCRESRESERIRLSARIEVSNLYGRKSRYFPLSSWNRKASLIIDILVFGMFENFRIYHRKRTIGLIGIIFQKRYSNQSFI